MRKKRSPLTSFSFSGAITFFILIALTMQFAILLYEYICKRTTSIPLLAVLILIEIIMTPIIEGYAFAMMRFSNKKEKINKEKIELIVVFECIF